MRSPIDRIWQAREVRQWLAVDNRPAKVFRVSGGPGLLVVVRSDELESVIESLQKEGGRQHRKAPAHRLRYEVSAVSSRPLKGYQGTFRLTDLGFVLPQEGLRETVLRRRPLVPERGGDGRRLKRKGQKLWDALAVAGTRASAGGKPRAVLLMLGSDARDESDLSPRSVVRYLRSIHVPLFVWAPSGTAFERFDEADSVRPYVGRAQIDRLCLDIADELASQTIVWLYGTYIPSDVTIEDGAPRETSFVE